MQDLLEGKKQIHVDPKYLPPLKYEESPPDYDEEEGIDYSLNEKVEIDMILDDISVRNYSDIEKQLSEPYMTEQKRRGYLR